MAKVATMPAAHQMPAADFYGIEDLRKHWGWGRDWLRGAKRNGLKVKKIGRRVIVLRTDLLAYLEAQEPVTI